jgi:phosphoglycerol transferase
LDDALFPDLLPNLQSLEQRSLSFQNIHQVYGTGWTIAGMTASQCGIAFVTPLITDRNSMFGVENFLPKANCLSDLLQEQGYDMHFIKGSALSFAGVGNFYKSHSFKEVSGRDYYLKKLGDANVNKNYWGVYDDTLFEQAKKKYQALQALDNPFGLFLITIDTHNPGYPSESCADNPYADGDNAVLNAIRCSDSLASDFIREVINSEGFDDTILVVASDHFAMKFSNSAWDKLQQAERRNLLMMFGQDLPAQVNDKPGSTLDVGPTVLGLLGYDVSKLGFGRSLLQDEDTLFVNVQAFNSFLVRHSDYLKSLWYPE